MLNQKSVIDALNKQEISFFTGVPDSYLNGFCNYILGNVPKNRNVIVANEGNAIGIASGYYFATRKIALVYMQNSGMGNAINPLVSLADENVYSVPMLLLIGWRGENGTGDWPQHKLQGEITPKLLDIMGIPYRIVENDDSKIEETIAWAADTARMNRKPVALIARKGVFAGEKIPNVDNKYVMSREEAINVILDCMPADTIYSATTGRTTRELYFLRDRRRESHKNDFLNVGAMGHTSSVALGIAMEKPDRQVVCLDGDAAAIMHMGCFTMASCVKAPNMIHIVLNNGAHESVGGQPTVGHIISFTGIAENAGYHTVGKAVTTREELANALVTLQKVDKASFLEVRIHKGLSGKLPPLNISHHELIDELINELNN